METATEIRVQLAEGNRRIKVRRQKKQSAIGHYPRRRFDHFGNNVTNNDRYVLIRSCIRYIENTAVERVSDRHEETFSSVPGGFYKSHCVG